jgi:hypothetical protein
MVGTRRPEGPEHGNQRKLTLPEMHGSRKLIIKKSGARAQTSITQTCEKQVINKYDKCETSHKPYVLKHPEDLHPPHVFGKL